MLSDEQVADRVETTLKLSNVTGDSAQQVSDYMTSIWNNFYDGSESLESFADKITALGAATASSSAEIANGLQQFAAIGNTVGLSYDYAATALATVVAQTRQSETVVGNAFRTIFSRLQGLRLGETLEDGTDLNKYSKALASVGVSIKDATGNLRSMDDILDDLGAKWQTLSKDQQTALAQTIGGTRQYTQLIALMDHWDKFKENLEITQNSEGSLQKQADIYAESWEAARKRVQAAWQAIYQDLIDDKFLISLNNDLATVLKGVDKLIDSMGGLKGVLSGIGILVTQIFQKQMAQGLQNAQRSIQSWHFNKNKQSITDLRREGLVDAMMFDLNETDFNTPSDTVEAAAIQGMRDQLDLTYSLRQVYSELTDDQKEFAVGLTQQVDELHQSVVEATQLRQTLKQQAKDSFNAITDKVNDAILKGNVKDHGDDFVTTLNDYSVTSQGEAKQNLKTLLGSYNTEDWDRVFKQHVEDLAKEGQEYGVTTAQCRSYLEIQVKLYQAYQKLATIQDNYKDSLDRTKDVIKQLKDAKQRGLVSDQYVAAQLTNLISKRNENIKSLEEEIEAAKKDGEAHEDLDKKLEAEIAIRDKLQKELDATNGKKIDGDNIVQIANGISKLQFGLSSLTNIWDIFSNKNISNGEKAVSIIGSISMGLPGLITGFEALSVVTGPLVAGLITAGLVALNIIPKIVDAWKSAYSIEGKLKTASDQLKEAQQVAEDAATAYDNLKTSLENLGNARTELDSLTQGTAEYTQAVHNYNSEILDLLSAYGLLDRANYEYKDGIIELNDGVKDQINNLAALRKSITETAEGIAKANEADLSAQKRQQDLVKLAKQKAAAVLLPNNNSNGSEDWNDSLLTRINATGLSVEKALDVTSKTLEDTGLTIDDTQEGLEAVTNALQVAGFGEYSDDFANLIFTNSELRDAIEDNTRAQEEANVKAETVAGEEGRTILGDNINYVDKPFQEGFAEYAGQQKAEKGQQIYNSQYANRKSLSDYTDEEKSNYAKIMGLGYDSILGFTDEFGKALEKEAQPTADQIGRILASSVVEAVVNNATYQQNLASEYMGSLSDEQKSSMYSKYYGSLRPKQLTQDEIDQQYSELQGSSGEYVETTQRINSALSEGNLNTKESKQLNEDLSQLTDVILPKLVTLYPELTKAQEILNETSLQGTQEYADALMQVEDQLQALNKESLQQANEEAYNKLADNDYFKSLQGLKVEVDETDWLEFVQDVDDFVDTDKTINVAVHTDAENNFEAITDEFNDMETYASKIGSDYKVAADDLRELNNVFPGILENMQILGDGTVQLNQTAVQGAMEAAQAEAQADAQSTVQRMENQSKLLHTKAIAYQSMADAAAKLGSDETLSAEDSAAAQQQISDALTTIKNTNSQLTQQQADQDQVAIANSAEVNGKATAQNWASAAQSIANSIWEAADSAIKSFDAIKAGEGLGGRPKLSGSTFSGVTGQSKESELLEATGSKADWSSYSKDTWKQLSAQYQAMADAVGSAANDIDGMIAQVSAGGTALTNGLNNVSSGKGYGPKSGSGGGGKDKKKETKEHEEEKEEEDRYHNIKEAIEDLTTALDRLDKTQDRVYGKAKLKYMDQEINKLQKQIDLTDEYIKEIKQYAAVDRAKLAGIGAGAQFDSEGMLTNYEQVLQNLVGTYNAAVATYNGAVDSYNASAQEDADKEALNSAKSALDAAEKKYDANKKILDQYEDTYNLLQEQLDKRIDQVWALFDKRLEQVTYRVDFEIDWNEEDIKYLDWLVKYNDKINDVTDSIAKYAKQMEIANTNVEQAKKGIKDIFALYNTEVDPNNTQGMLDSLTRNMYEQGLPSQMTEESVEKVKDYMQDLMDYYDKQMEAWKNAHEAMIDAWNEWNGKIRDSIDVISDYGSTMEHIEKIIDATGRKLLHLNTGDVARMNQAIIDNANAQVKAEKSLVDDMLPTVERAKQAYEEAVAAGLSDTTQKKLYDEWQQFESDYQDQLNNYYNAWEQALDAIEKQFEKTMENMSKDYDESFGKLGLNWLSDEFDRQKDVRGLYLDDYEKYHELNKSAKALAESLEKTTNDMLRGKMVKLQDEINGKMDTGVKISAAQAEIIARRVALLQAEANLLDAENAKSNVRMTRDNEGNFSYTYTADQDAINDAQEEYADKFYDLLKYERDYMDQIQSEMLQKRQEFIDKLNDLADQYKDDQEGFEAAAEQLRNDYLQYMDYYVGEQDMDMQEMARLRDDDWQDFEYHTNSKLAEQDDFITNFKDTIYGDLADAYNTAEEDAANWEKAMDESCAQATKAVSVYQRNTEKSYEAAGENIDKYGQKSVQNMEKIADQSEETADAVDEMTWQMNDDMQQIQSQVYELDQQWGASMDNMRNAIAQLINSLENLLRNLQEVQNQAVATANAISSIPSGPISTPNNWSSTSSNGGGGTGNGGGASGGNRGGNPGGAGRVYYIYDSEDVANGNARAGGQGALASGTKWEMEALKKKWLRNAGSNSGMHYVVGLDTGGYTGKWGANGRLAMLHEKELVLNKEDTANMLDMVNTVRDMVSSIGSNSMLDKTILSAASAAGLIGVPNSTLDQNVHIEANFPNVESHTEIETALNNLINSASQYVNRR